MWHFAYPYMDLSITEVFNFRFNDRSNISGDVKKNVSSAIGTEDENIYLNYILGQLGTCRGLYTFFSQGKHQGARCSLRP